MPPQQKNPIPTTPAPDPVATEPLAVPTTLLPVEFPRQRTVNDIPNTVELILEAHAAIREQLAADVLAQLDDPAPGHANLAAAITTLSNAIDTIAQFQA